MRHKSKITHIGTISEDGTVCNWCFNGEKHPDSAGYALNTKTGEEWFGGYTKDELREVARTGNADLWRNLRQ